MKTIDDFEDPEGRRWPGPVALAGEDGAAAA